MIPLIASFNRLAGRAAVAALCAALLIAGESVYAADAKDTATETRSTASDAPAPGVIRAPLQAEASEGAPISRVFLDLTGESGLAEGDAETRRQIEEALGLRAGTTFQMVTSAIALQRVQALPFVKSATYRLYESSDPGYVIFALSAHMAPEPVSGKPLPEAGFPVLHRDDKSLLQVQLSGGVGLYHDRSPWYGDAEGFTSTSPIALDPADGGSATWFEADVEYGVAGATRLGDSSAYLYGAATALTAFSTGQDLYRSDTRAQTATEDLYAGVVAARPGGDWSANVSLGRQNWQLNDGFLFSRYAAGSNAGPNPGLYLNPRTAYQQTALAKVCWREWSLEGFFLNPAELKQYDSNTKYEGLNLAWAKPGRGEASIVHYRVPTSNTNLPVSPGVTVPREGMRTTSVRASVPSVFSVKGLDLTGEYAWQSHSRADWDAEAWYVRAGYAFEGVPWRPNLSYRYSHFSGDDPATSQYERFDAQLSSGLDNWVQGVSARKVIGNSNLNCHRVRLNFFPRESYSVTLDYFRLSADKTGGSSEYAQEVDAVLRWPISRTVYLLGVAGLSMPGDALRERVGGGLDNWLTTQVSLFVNF